jgi:hypothetical protein
VQQCPNPVGYSDGDDRAAKTTLKPADDLLKSFAKDF